MEFCFAAGTIISVTLLGAASPGPDTALILKQGLLGSRKNAFATVLGIITGNTLYVFVAVLGLGVILVNSGFVYVCVQILGALYLLYLGIKLMRTCKGSNIDSERLFMSITPWQAYREGLTTNVLNPKFVLFLLALFSQVIQPEWPLVVQLLLGMLVPLTALNVFIFLVYAITHEKFKAAITSSRVYIERVMGAILIALSAKVVLSIGTY